MSVVVAYPVEVKSYTVWINRNTASIELEGIEMGEEESAPAGKSRRVGRIEFGDPNPASDRDFITRGGFLRMDRPLVMLASILALLQNEKPLFLRDDGTLSTTSEPVGAGEEASS